MGTRKNLFQPEEKSTLSDSEILREIYNHNRDIIVELFNPTESENLSDGEIATIKNDFVKKLCLSLPSFKYTPESQYFSDSLVTLSPLYFDESESKFLIESLRSSPIVKCFYPTPIIDFSEIKTHLQSKLDLFPKHQEEIDYPKIILVDKGIRSNLLQPWVTDRSDALGDEYLADYHADEMASILIGSKYLNEKDYLEIDGCEIYDIWLPSTIDTFDDQFGSLSEFMDWLYLEIQSARESGYRIISMSINFQNIASEHEYSSLASRIDMMSEKLGVLFVISAGNLNPKQYRPEWPKSVSDVFKMLARYQHDDKILQPADSVSAITVGSFNHIENELITFGAPTRYTRRGPSTAYGIKPDLVHVGEIGDFSNSYLQTLDGKNNILSSSHGTSMATPHVAKTLALLDTATKQQLSINSLKALMLHNASVHKCLDSKELSKEAREYAGFGFPSISTEIINKEETSFTFLFENSLNQGQIAEFNFSWPQSLTTPNGKCKGKIKMTLVYEPPIDRNFGQEYIRANVDASLQQEKVKGDSFSFKKEVHSIWDSKKKAVNSIWEQKLGEDSHYEKNLIKHGFKWWPNKVYERISNAGFGNSINWRLRVTSQVRDGVQYPKDGVKFSVVITIEDPSGTLNNVYNEMRQIFTQIGVGVQDITIRDEVRV